MTNNLHNAFSPKPISYYSAEEPQALIKDLMHHPSLTLLHANTGGMKSLFSLYMAAQIAEGKPVLGYETEQRNVYYIDFEMSSYSIGKRAKDLDITHIPVNQLAYITSPQDNTNFDFSDGEVQEAFIEFIANTDYEILILDNLRTGFVVQDENAAGEFTKINNFLKRLRSIGKSVMLIHHDNKSSDFAGSSNITVPYDYRIQVESVDGEPTYKTLRIHKDRDASGLQANLDYQQIRFDDGSFYAGEDGIETISEKLELIVCRVKNKEFTTIESLGKAVADTGYFSHAKGNFTYSKIAEAFDSMCIDSKEVNTTQKLKEILKSAKEAEQAFSY